MLRLPSWKRHTSIRTRSSVLDPRVGCNWRAAELRCASPHAEAPLGFVRYRQQMAARGAAVSFRLPSMSESGASCSLKLLVRMGCIGAAATSGRFAVGGIVTPSNAQMCGNKSGWWGFTSNGVPIRNADGAIRDAAGPGLAAECAAIATVGSEDERLQPGAARATGAHALSAACVIHALPPTSHRSPGSEAALRRTYLRVFELAEQRDLPCLALPALSCGIAGFPPAVGARAALDAVGAYSARARDDDAAETDGDHTRAVHALSVLEFVLLDERVYAAFADAAHARWGR